MELTHFRVVRSIRFVASLRRDRMRLILSVELFRNPCCALVGIARGMKAFRRRRKAHGWWNIRLTSLQTYHIVKTGVFMYVVDVQAYVSHAQPVLFLTCKLLIGT